MCLLNVVPFASLQNIWGFSFIILNYAPVYSNACCRYLHRFSYYTRSNNSTPVNSGGSNPIASWHKTKWVNITYLLTFCYSNLSNGVLGFDCEWVNDGPVALLQLATFNGVCALFRIGKIGFIPFKLKVYRRISFCEYSAHISLIHGNRNEVYFLRSY